tara:strand:+ start:292 stop:429 length:138 start_codon:yes stop_codon:yes gene_type:complete
MPTKTKKVTKTTNDTDVMKQTISNLTDIVSKLKSDVSRIKIRLGL